MGILLERNQFKDWKPQRACKGKDPSFFFPQRGNTVAILEAKAFCKTECNVREDCLEYALINNETEGVWGGTSGKERRVIRPRWVRTLMAEARDENRLIA